MPKESGQDSPRGKKARSKTSSGILRVPASVWRGERPASEEGSTHSLDETPESLDADSPQALYLATVEGFPELLRWAAGAIPTGHALQVATELVASYSPEQVISAIRNTPSNVLHQKPGYARALVVRALSFSMGEILGLMASDCLDMVKELGEIAGADSDQTEDAQGTSSATSA